MNYCARCILPDSRPNLVIDGSGVCSACRTFRARPEIDWNSREILFRRLVEETKGKASKWDCVIPVSGGKDSTWQVVTALKYGMKPLCVTWRTPGRSPLGQKNLENLVRLGVDHLDLTINPELERRLTLKALKTKGSPAIPMHLAIFALPLQVSVRFGIPLVLWGENSAVEYGGGDGQGFDWKMSREWLLRYGVTNGTVAEDWIDPTISEKDLAIYHWPTDQELESADVRAAFLGHFFAWDPVMTYRVAEEHGFEATSGRPTTGIYEFADVDDSFLISIHHWIKWMKFGFTRTWDNLSLEIRNGRLTREEAIQIVRARGNEEPGEEINRFCEWVGISRTEFDGILETFRNSSVWKREGGVWVIPAFLIPDWKWK